MLVFVPELPEVEITARRLNATLAGAPVESAFAPGMVTMKTFDPPLDSLAGRTIAGIGRSWVDEILWTAELSPFKKGDSLDDDEIARLREAMDEVLGGALDHYEEVVGESLPDKAPMPLKVHRRQGEVCPRCGTRLEAVHFKDYVMTYCPKEQTG